MAPARVVCTSITYSFVYHFWATISSNSNTQFITYILIRPQFADNRNAICLIHGVLCRVELFHKLVQDFDCSGKIDTMSVSGTSCLPILRIAVAIAIAYCLHCLQPIVYSLLPVACCSCNAYRLLPIGCRLWPISCCPLLIAYSLLPIAYYQEPAAYCLLPVASCHSQQPIVYDPS